ncbi:MAG TPA: hypothetical protein VEU33_21140 [Archangium sp.]|nr:hypothetical protein [Archangium sp.]
MAELQAYLAQRPGKLAGNDYQIHELLGRGHLLRNDPAAARLSFERAQVGRTESVSMQMGLGAVLEMEGKMAEAMALLEGLTVRFLPGDEGGADRQRARGAGHPHERPHGPRRGGTLRARAQ